MAPVIYRCVENSAGFEVLVEHVIPDEPAAGDTAPLPGPGAARTSRCRPFPHAALTDADLDLTPEERREFE